MSKVILGIDIAKLTFSTALLLEGKYRYKDFDNNKSGYDKLDHWLKSTNIPKIEICLEATGTYGDALADSMYSLGYIVKVINPLQIKSFAKAKLSRHKTDKVDASIIAEYGLKFESFTYEPIPLERKELQALYRCAQDLKDQITFCINHMENQDLLPKLVADSWIKTKVHYEDQLKILHDRIMQIIQSDKDLTIDFDNLLTIKGIGQCTAIAILAELPRIGNFQTARQLAAYIGLTPKHHISGSSVTGRPKISKMGNSIMRKALFFPAISAIRHNEYFREFALKLEKRGKAKKSIICAVMRKMVHVIAGVLKSKKGFDIDVLQAQYNS
jgi:transposase